MFLIRRIVLSPISKVFTIPWQMVARPQSHVKGSTLQKTKVVDSDFFHYPCSFILFYILIFKILSCGGRFLTRVTSQKQIKKM